jgi:hypothetical protein
MIAVVMSAPTTQSGFRRWLRFSLRTFFLLVTVLCVWLGIRVNQARRQKEAVEALRMRGFYVNYEHWRSDQYPEYFNSSRELPVPTWLRNLAGDDFFQKAVAIRFVPTSSDDDCIHLAALPHIEGLYVGGRGNDVSDVGLAHLPRPDRLVHFNAASTLVGDGFVKRLANANGLETLELSGTRVTDEGLQALPRLPKLKQLGLGNTQIGDKGLAAVLKDRSSLEVLWLQGTQITDESLALLKDAKRLRFLFLDDTQIRDAGLRHLYDLPALWTVHVDGTQVTSEGMAAIAALPAHRKAADKLARLIEESDFQRRRNSQLPEIELPAQDKPVAQRP